MTQPWMPPGGQQQPQGQQPPQWQPPPAQWPPAIANAPAPAGAPSQQWQPPQSAPQQWQPPGQQSQEPPQGQGQPSPWLQQPQQPAPQQWQQPQGQPQGQPQQRWQPSQQWQAPEDPFGNLDNASPSGQRGEFFEAGNYHIRISATTIVEARSGKNFYTIESDIIASDNPGMPPGTRATAMIDLTNKDMRDKNMMTFLAAAMGYDPALFPKGAMPPNGGTWTSLAHETLGPRRPLVGLEMAVRAITRTKRDNTGEYTDLGWLPKAALQIGPMRAPIAPPPPATGGWSPQQGATAAPQQQPAAGGWGAPPTQGPNSWGRDVPF